MLRKVARKAIPFDPRAFLTKVRTEKTVRAYRTN
jgi:hypothetical protein